MSTNAETQPSTSTQHVYIDANNYVQDNRDDDDFVDDDENDDNTSVTSLSSTSSTLVDEDNIEDATTIKAPLNVKNSQTCETRENKEKLPTPPPPPSAPSNARRQQQQQQQQLVQRTTSLPSLPSTSSHHDNDTSSNASDKVSSVEFVMNSNRSETGITEKFSDLQCVNNKNKPQAIGKKQKQKPPPPSSTPSIQQAPAPSVKSTASTSTTKTRQTPQIVKYAQSSSGLTEGIVGLSLAEELAAAEAADSNDDDFYIEDDDNPLDGVNEPRDEYCICPDDQKVCSCHCRRFKKYNILDERCKIFIHDMVKKRDTKPDQEVIYSVQYNKKRKYNIKYLETLYDHRSDEELQEIFDTYEEYHSMVDQYLQEINYVREDDYSIRKALLDAKRDPDNRLKQAVYLYLLSKFISIKGI